jgi:hypothetical protein
MLSGNQNSDKTYFGENFIHKKRDPNQSGKTLLANTCKRKDVGLVIPGLKISTHDLEIHMHINFL